MNTAKAAHILGISKSTLLRWISSGLIEDVERNQKGWRVWSNDDILRVSRFIKTYKGSAEDYSNSFAAQNRYKRALTDSMFYIGKYGRFKKEKNNDEKIAKG
ncbi:MAG: MerR family transcriptional regulator [Candidatus Aminicenantes bacterium]|nr:MerR family transcriptional regulator [Candidatus Aminicenantes bacterium]